MSRILGRLGLGLLPLALTPLLVWLIGEGYLNFGGGCKDVVLLLPWTGWSLIFLLISLVCWKKKVAAARSLAYATSGATVAVVLALIILAVWQFAALGLKP